MAERMKNNSMKTAPKGRIPPRDREDWVHVPHLRWHLSRYLIGSDWVFNGWLLKSKVAAKEDEGNRDTKPKGNDSY
jgi:hypothetical protein